MNRPPFVFRGEVLLLRRFDQDECFLKRRVKELFAVAMNDGVARPHGLEANERMMFPPIVINKPKTPIV